MDQQDFRRVLGHFAAGVTVVTTISDEGKPHGLTVTAFTAVSLEPPLVLVCIDRRSESHPHFLSSRVFAVNLLTASQEDLSRRFAVSGGDKFVGVAVRRGVTGAPLLREALGYLECRARDICAAGDHTIFVGQVEAADARTGEPLLYFRGAYRHIAM